MPRTRTDVKHRSWFHTALETIGRGPMTIHDLRHTVASLPVSAGANMKAVQRELGHASAVMTLGVDGTVLPMGPTRFQTGSMRHLPARMWAKSGKWPNQPQSRLVASPGIGHRALWGVLVIEGGAPDPLRVGPIGWIDTWR